MSHLQGGPENARSADVARRNRAQRAGRSGSNPVVSRHATHGQKEDPQRVRQHRRRRRQSIRRRQNIAQLLGIVQLVLVRRHCGCCCCTHVRLSAVVHRSGAPADDRRGHGSHGPVQGDPVAAARALRHRHQQAADSPAQAARRPAGRSWPAQAARTGDGAVGGGQTGARLSGLRQAVSADAPTAPLSAVRLGHVQRLLAVSEPGGGGGPGESGNTVAGGRRTKGRYRLSSVSLRSKTYNILYFQYIIIYPCK